MKSRCSLSLCCLLITFAHLPVVVHAADAVPANASAATPAANAAYQQATEMVKALKLTEAVTFLTRAAEGGHVTAMRDLGDMYFMGFGAPVDPALAAKWYKAAADRGDASAAKTFAEIDAQIKGGLLEYNAGLAAYRAKDLAGAIKQWEVAVTKGNAPAMGLLGMFVFDGAGGTPNPTRAISLWEKGASLGDALSLLQLGMCYENGEGVPADPAKAITLYERSATAGNVQAMYQAALMYAYGTRIPENSPKAIAWWKQAAERGDPRSLHALGQSYELGQNATRNYAEALAWYEKALTARAEGADQAVKRVKGLQASQAEWTQAESAKAAKNLPLAISWYEKAAAKGNVHAMTELAGIYETGAQAPRDYAKAYAYYLQADQLGAPMADGSAQMVKMKMEAEDPVGTAKQMNELRDRINQTSPRD